jgi:hypothetical protein
MKTRKNLVVLFVFAAFLLSACQVNFITDIQSNGSGTYTQEIGFQGDEASMAGLSAGDEEFCAKQNEDLPPGTTIRQETRNENETWCVYESPFKSLDDLKSIYGMTDTRINDISLVDGILTYDISLDLSGDGGAPMGADIAWIVTLPGSIIENNASEQMDKTLKWKLVGGQVNNIRAVSEVGGLNLDFDGGFLWYIFGGGVLLCLCCFVPLLIAGLAFFLIRRKKNLAAAESLAP